MPRDHQEQSATEEESSSQEDASLYLQRFIEVFSSLDDVDVNDEARLLQLVAECETCLEKLGTNFRTLASELERNEEIPKKIHQLLARLDKFGQSDAEHLTGIRLFLTFAKKEDIKCKALLEHLLAQDENAKNDYDDILKEYQEANAALSAVNQALEIENTRLNRLVIHFQSLAGIDTIDPQELSNLIQRTSRNLEDLSEQLSSIPLNNYTAEDLRNFYQERVALAANESQTPLGHRNNFLARAIRRLYFNYVLQGKQPKDFDYLEKLIVSQAAVIDQQSNLLKAQSSFELLVSELKLKIEGLLALQLPSGDYNQVMQELLQLQAELSRFKNNEIETAILKEENERLRIENQKLAEDLYAVIEEKTGLEDALSNFKAEGAATNDGLKNGAEKQNNGQEFSLLRKRISELEETLKQRDAHNQKSQDDLERKKTENATIRDKLLHAEAAMESLQKDLDRKKEALESERGNPKKFLKDAQNALNEVKAQLQTLKRDNTKGTWTDIKQVCRHRAFFTNYRLVSNQLEAQISAISSAIVSSSDIASGQLTELDQRESEFKNEINRVKAASGKMIRELVHDALTDIERDRKISERQLAEYKAEQTSKIDIESQELAKKHAALKVDIADDERKLSELQQKIADQQDKLNQLEKRIPELQTQKEQEIIDRHAERERVLIAREKTQDQLEAQAYAAAKDQLREEFEKVQKKKKRLKDKSTQVTLQAENLHFIHVIGLMYLPEKAEKAGLSMGIKIAGTDSYEIANHVFHLYTYLHHFVENAWRYRDGFDLPYGCKDDFNKVKDKKYQIEISLRGDIKDIRAFLSGEFSRHMKNLTEGDLKKIDGFYATPNLTGKIEKNEKPVHNIIYAPLHSLPEKMPSIVAAL